jgi:methyl-accepting chemotaxis protein
MLCRIITHRQLLPLRMLTRATQRIAEGNYDETIPDSHRQDEIGRLQDNFQQMQHSLASHVNELEQLKTTLNEHGKELENAYQQAKEAERMKTAFLHNMTNQMVSPADNIVQDMNTICNSGNKMSQEEANQLANDLQSQGKTIVELLRNLLDIADTGKGKEEAND